jgi:hypothetical protein
VQLTGNVAEKEGRRREGGGKEIECGLTFKPKEVSRAKFYESEESGHFF